MPGGSGFRRAPITKRRAAFSAASQRRTAMSNLLVAEPLLESAPDYESKEMILKLTTLAWNFTLLDPIEQEEMLAEIADLFQCPEGMDMFYYLADRKELLFPEEERVILKVETRHALYSDIGL